ncbi:MAG: enoyl-CoA hydratase/isomerase family protein [Rubellimicrobium sp.]|nr:enoyl-CoA hydratase/isomerase family protein [Rubellimicrobium sp.]
MTDQDILVSRQGAVGHLRLNQPAALNSLTPEMIAGLDRAIDRHLADPGVRVLVLSGAGERGLCAGADIKALSRLGREDPAAAMAFWAAEYRLNARIAHLPKPWVALMDGICMGGGAGLSIHGAHRVMTERSRFAMPETGIGYFPDVGASFRLQGALGLWIGLTGDSIGVADAIAAGLADAMVPSAALPALVAALASGRAPADAIAAHAADPGPAPVADGVAGIARAFDAPDMAGIVAALEQAGSPFAERTLATLRARSPSSLVLTLHLLREGARAPDLESCLERDLAADALILTRADFHEGIRAQVIDRDRNPRWSPATLAEVDGDALLRQIVAQPPLFPPRAPGAARAARPPETRTLGDAP